jgi:hypothetical protein
MDKVVCPVLFFTVLLVTIIINPEDAIDTWKDDNEFC